MNQNGPFHRSNWDLQVSSQLLLTFNGFKQGFEISFSEGSGSLSLNDFKEKGRSILNGLSKNM